MNPAKANASAYLDLVIKQPRGIVYALMMLLVLRTDHSLPRFVLKELSEHLVVRIGNRAISVKICSFEFLVGS